MQDSLDQFGRGDVAIKYRDARFAELDAQIKSEVAARQQKQGSNRPKRRRNVSGLPATIREEIAHCARPLREHRKLFIADPKLKDRAARSIRRRLGALELEPNCERGTSDFGSSG